MELQLFVMGEVKISPEAKAALERTGTPWGELVAQHGAGEYGDISEAQNLRNRQNTAGQGGVLSSYNLPDGTRLNLYTNMGRDFTFIVVEGQALAEATQ